jgi:hypothetical protein
MGFLLSGVQRIASSWCAPILWSSLFWAHSNYVFDALFSYILLPAFAAFSGDGCSLAASDLHTRAGPSALHFLTGRSHDASVVCENCFTAPRRDESEMWRLLRISLREYFELALCVQIGNYRIRASKLFLNLRNYVTLTPLSRRDFWSEEAREDNN